MQFRQVEHEIRAEQVSRDEFWRDIDVNYRSQRLQDDTRTVDAANNVLPWQYQQQPQQCHLARHLHFVLCSLPLHALEVY